MKYKVIALAVSGALLTACGSDNDNFVVPTSTAVQAFDGAVRFLDTYIECNDGGFEYVGETEGNGTINIGEGNFPLFDEDPSQCIFEFGEGIYGSGGGTRRAQDESNGKFMDTVRYLAPPQLISSNGSITATPHSTLIALKILEAQENGEAFDLDTIIRESFESTLPSGTDFDEFDLDEMKAFLASPQAALDGLDSETSKNLQASTMVLSDAIAGSVAADSFVISDIESTTQSAATDLASNPGFPVNEDGNPTFVELDEDFKNFFDGTSSTPPTAPTEPDDLEEGEVLESIPEGELPPPDEELPPPTGGTGGTAG